MTPQFTNLATSSFLLWLDNRISSQHAYYTVNSQFYPINQTYAGYSVYSAPYGALVSDFSVTNNILTGVYINNVFTPVGTYPLSGINYDKSQIYLDPNFTTINPVSGANYSIKEINTALTNFSDISVLFESKIALRPKQPQIPTGLNNNILTYPTIFIENESSKNEPWAIGGLDSSYTTISCYIFAESKFQLDAICSLFADSRYKYIPLIDQNQMPFNNLGGYMSGVQYNYNVLTTGKVPNGYSLLVEEVETNNFGKRSLNADVVKMTTDAFFSIGTFRIWRARISQ